jgi:hypothetical protein
MKAAVLETLDQLVLREVPEPEIDDYFHYRIPPEFDKDEKAFLSD